MYAKIYNLKFVSTDAKLPHLISQNIWPNLLGLVTCSLSIFRLGLAVAVHNGKFDGSLDLKNFESKTKPFLTT